MHGSPYLLLLLLRNSVQLNHNPPVSSVTDKKIASISKNKIREIFCPADFQYSLHLFKIPRHNKYFCRTADSKSCMTFHRFFQKHSITSKLPAKLLFYFFIHRFCPLSFYSVNILIYFLFSPPAGLSPPLQIPAFLLFPAQTKCFRFLPTPGRYCYLSLSCCSFPYGFFHENITP